LTGGAGHTNALAPLKSSHVNTVAGVWGNLTETHDASMGWGVIDDAAGRSDDCKSACDGTWTDADGDEETPSRRKRTGAEMREAAAHRRAACSTMGPAV